MHCGSAYAKSRHSSRVKNEGMVDVESMLLLSRWASSFVAVLSRDVMTSGGIQTNYEEPWWLGSELVHIACH